MPAFGLDRYGLHVDPSANALCVETAMPRVPTIMQRGDRLPALTATLYDPQGEPVDLTGATVTFNLRRRRERTLKVDGGLCTVLDAVNGRVEYPWAAGDTAEPGVFDAHFRVTAGGLVESFPNWKSHEVQIHP